MADPTQARLSFVLYQELSLVDPGLQQALQSYVQLLRDALKRLANKHPFKVAVFHEAQAQVPEGAQPGQWQLGVVAYQNGVEVARFSLDRLLQAQAPQPGSAYQWDSFDVHQRGPAVARVLRMLRLLPLWRSMQQDARDALDAAFAAPARQQAVAEQLLNLAQLLHNDDRLFRCLPQSLRAQLRKVHQHLESEKQGAPSLSPPELDSLLQSISMEVKAELPNLLRRAPAERTAELADVLNQLQALELAATGPLSGLVALVAFVVDQVAEFQGLPAPPSSPLSPPASPLPFLLPVRLLRRVWRVVSSIRLPNPNRIARQAKLRGEIVALTLVEGVHDFWDLSCKLARLLAHHSRRAVKPLLFAVVLSQVTSALVESRDPMTVMMKLPPNQRVDYYYSQLLGADWKEQIQNDLLDAIDEVRQGLVTEHMLEEKKLISAAILRRLDRAAYDRMAQYMAFDMFQLNENYKNAEDGESEEMMRWKQIQDKMYDWFYVISRFGKNAHEWAGKIKTYPQDLDPWAIDFNEWAKDLIQTGYQKHLPAPSLINDRVDPVHMIASAPGFSSLDPMAVNAALMEPDPVKRGKMKIFKDREPEPERVLQVPVRRSLAAPAAAAAAAAASTSAAAAATDEDEDEGEWETVTDEDEE